MSLAKRAVQRLTRATQAFLTSSLSKSTVILNYHRVNAPTHPANNLTVSVDRFREQMRTLRDHFDPVPLSSVGPANPRGTRRPVVVTFDDGYADTFLNAVPVLREFGIPASVFITTGFVGRKAEFWWDELEELLISRIPVGTPLRFPLPAGTLPADYETMDRGALYLRLTGALKLAGIEAIESTLQELRKIADSSPLARDPQRPLTREELIEMGREPLVEIGAHTVSHPSLGTLSRDRQNAEMSESKRMLEETLARQVTSIAYPFGSATDFNGDTLALARELGFRVGLTTVPGVVAPSSDPHALPRMFVQDWKGDDFRRRLERFFWTA
jgi:peptidoglycan/xylan/chitin deacetylase (PgdA/CDA1 family)